MPTASNTYRVLQAALAPALVLGAILFVAVSRRWLLVGDAPLIHYVVFLAQHGLTPYRDIIDLNLPGTLAVEAG